MSIVNKRNEMKYDLILSDPPWKQARGGKKNKRPNSSGMGLEYSCMSIKDIGAIQRSVKSLCRPNHILFLWTIDKYLHESEQMVTNMGYKIHARMIWNKVTGIPSAFTIRYGHEYLLYCYYGKLLPVALDQRGKIHSVFTEKVKRHSQKPETSYKIIESLYPESNKVELYSRNKRAGWHSWGNEIESDISI